MELKKYYPYKSIVRPSKKFFIITNDNKKIYFGDSNFQHFTSDHLDERRRLLYISRHRKNEDWKNPNTSGYWSMWFLWDTKTYEQAYKKIRKDLKEKGFI